MWPAARLAVAFGTDRWAPPTPRRTAVLAIFLLSGAAGLVYEVVWARQLVLVFGNTTQAVSAILTGFFGGMAIGSVIGGRVADRVRPAAAPVRLPRADPGGRRAAHAGPVPAACTRSTAPATAASRSTPGSSRCSGTRWPCWRWPRRRSSWAPRCRRLSRHLARGRAQLGRAFGRLYAANTVGAIVGTVARRAGAHRARRADRRRWSIGAICSRDGRARRRSSSSAHRGPRASGARRRDAAIAAETAREPRRSAPRAAGDCARFRLPAGRARAGPGPPRVALAVAFVSGLTSLGYQLLWTRLLASGSRQHDLRLHGDPRRCSSSGSPVGAIVARLVGRSPGWSGRAACGRLGAIQIVVAAIVLVGPGRPQRPAADHCPSRSG